MGLTPDSSFDDVIKHFGIKGMRWGVRRSEKQLHPGGGSAVSEDHARANAARMKAKRGGTKTLTNKELQDLITRINLEQQYSRLAPPGIGVRLLKSGSKITGDILLSVGKNQASKFAGDLATKQIASLLSKKSS